MERSSRSSSVGPSATLVAALLTVLGLPEIAAQRQLLPERRATETFRGREAAPGEVLVAFRRSPNLARLRAEIDADADTPISGGRLWHVRSRSRSVPALVAFLSRHSDVLYAEPNYIVYAQGEPNDPRFPELWGLRNIGQIIGGTPGIPGADIRAVSAWDRALGSRNTVVGIVDTGVDYTHPDLVKNVWSAPAAFSVTIGTQTITCAAGTHGFNALTRTCDPFDDNGHGTHVAGTIGAVASNNVGVAGVNWFASIMGLKFLTAGGSGTMANAINVIDFAIQAKAAFPGGGANLRVLSNSWAGGDFSQALADAIGRANQSEMLFVAAAGNSASNNDAVPTYPASYEVANVVAVAATSNQDTLASFSNYGRDSVHLGAPGVQVLSTLPGDTYGYFSGTSMATPHVSGAAALLLSRCAANTATVKSLLLNNVDQIAPLSGVTISGGRLNLDRAIEACGPAGNISPVVTLTEPSNDQTFPAPANVTLRANASDTGGTVANVSFYAGTALIGVDTAPPFEFNWTGAVVGNYVLTAVATDNIGATTTSAETTIHVLPGPGSLPFGGALAPIPGIVQAEQFNEGGEGVGYHDLTPGNAGGKFRQTDVDIENASDMGGGYSLGYVNAGEWLAYWVTAAVTADYTLDARVASLLQGGKFHIEVDGIDVTGPLQVPNTGGWQSWQTISRSGILLTAGPHLVRLVADSKGAAGYLGNLNYLRWTTPGINTAPTVQLTAPAGGAVYTAPATVALGATASDLDGTIAQVAFYAGSTRVGIDTTAPFSYSWINAAAGDYNLTAVATDNDGGTATSGVTAIRVVPPPPTTPFGSTAMPIPGVIEAENFDNGGEGVAYHDTTSGNTTGQYRQTDVDIEATQDVDGGYSLSYVKAGEWLKYSVVVASAGSYTMEARVASAVAGGTFHVEVDGIDATGPLAMPYTGGWQVWRSIVVNGIALSAGSHVVRVSIDTNGPSGWWGNLNALRWTVSGSPPPGSTPFGGTPASIPGVIEAENFDDGGQGVAYHDLTAGNATGQYRQTDVDVEAAQDSGGGYSLSYVNAGEWLTYSVNVATAGSYTLRARIASATASGTFHVEVDGVDLTGTMSVAATGGWQVWQTIARPGILLSAGSHRVKVVIDSNGVLGYFGNLNWLQWVAE